MLRFSRFWSSRSLLHLAVVALCSSAAAHAARPAQVPALPSVTCEAISQVALTNRANVLTVDVPTNVSAEIRYFARIMKQTSWTECPLNAQCPGIKVLFQEETPVGHFPGWTSRNVKVLPAVAGPFSSPTDVRMVAKYQVPATAAPCLISQTFRALPSGTEARNLLTPRPAENIITFTTYRRDSQSPVWITCDSWLNKPRTVWIVNACRRRTTFTSENVAYSTTFEVTGFSDILDKYAGSTNVCRNEGGTPFCRVQIQYRP